MNIIGNVHASTLLAALMFLLFYGTMLTVSHCFEHNFKSIRNATTRPNDRYGALDGLRGLLAYGVMAHHAITAYFYFSTGIWQWSDNPVLNHLGQSTVALFFMITGFLFTEKCSAASVNWRALYISRIARLAPLYILVIVVLFSAVFALSGFELHVHPLEFAKEFGQWLAFVCFGRPDINGMANSWMLIAGVNWSLRFEWIFYILGMPLLFLLSRFLSRKWLLIGSLFTLTIIIFVIQVRGSLHGAPLYLVHFLCGITAAFVYENEMGRRFISSRPFHLVSAASLVVMGFVPDSGSAPSLVTALLFFLATVGGLSFFGVLKTRSAIWLGDISYGIYMTHGLVLWTTFYTCKQMGVLGALDTVVFIAVLPAIGIIVMMLASTSYLYLEKPMVELGKKLSRSRQTAVTQPT